MKLTPLQKAREIEGKNRTNATAFALHCDGVKQKACGAKIIVPMGVLSNIDTLNQLMVDSDWRVNVGKFKNGDYEFPLAFVQCTDCWIDFYRHYISEHKKDSEKIIKKIDPTGKFHLRLNEVLENSNTESEKTVIETVKVGEDRGVDSEDSVTDSETVKNCKESLTSSAE